MDSVVSPRQLLPAETTVITLVGIEWLVYAVLRAVRSSLKAKILMWMKGRLLLLHPNPMTQNDLLTSIPRCRVAVLLPFVNLVEASNDPSSDTHTAYLRSTLRTRLLRTQSLEFVPHTIGTYITATLNHIEAEGLIDPFPEMNLYYTQSTMAVLGVEKVARSPELSRKIGELLGLLEGTFSATDIVIPWLLNPSHLRTVIGVARLYVMLWQIIGNQKKEQQQQPLSHKQESENVGILQDLITKGRSMRAMLQVSRGTRNYLPRKKG